MDSEPTTMQTRVRRAKAATSSVKRSPAAPLATGPNKKISRSSLPPSEDKCKQSNYDNKTVDVGDMGGSSKEILSSLHDSINEVKKQLDVQNNNVLIKMDELSNKLSIIDQLLAENIQLKERISTLESKFEKLEESGVGRCSTGGDVIEMDSIAGEMEDRHRRRKNIILCNLEESSKTGKADIQNDDRERVFNILKEADHSLSSGDIKCFRLGREGNKARPIKVMLKHQNQVGEIFKNKTRLGNSRIRIYRDQTVIQRNNYMKLKESFDARVQSGEKNIMIKYIKGCPKIVLSKFSKNYTAYTKTSGA